MDRQLVFIDDSGDPGFKKGASSSMFVMAGAIFLGEEAATLVNDAISDYRKSLGWQDNHEFKFRTTSKEIKLHLLQVVSCFDFDVYGVYVKKSDYPNVFQFSDNEKLYNWATKELLASMPLNEARVKIDGKYTKGYKLRVRSYIRHELNSKDSRKIEKFDVKDSRRDNLIQLTDIIVGSINRHFHQEKTDANEYYNIIKNKIIELKLLDLGDK